MADDFKILYQRTVYIRDTELASEIAQKFPKGSREFSAWACDVFREALDEDYSVVRRELEATELRKAELKDRLADLEGKRVIRQNRLVDRYKEWMNSVHVRPSWDKRKLGDNMEERKILARGILREHMLMNERRGKEVDNWFDSYEGFQALVIDAVFTGR